MKKAFCIILTALLIMLPLSGVISAEQSAEPENGTVLYETDFTNGIPEGFRYPKGHENKVYVKDGLLYVDAVGREFTRVFLPDTLDKYGNYEITIHATMIQQRDSGRWGSIIYRAQNVNYPYYQMCFRHDSNAGNGVEFALRNENDVWNVTSTGSVSGHKFASGTFDEIKATVKDERAIHSINGETGVDCTDATVYDKGGIGLQANYCILVVRDVKVTYLRSAGKTATAEYAEIAQSDLGVIGGYTLSEYVLSKEKLDNIAKSEAIPANAIFNVNSKLEVTDNDGKAFSTVSDALTALNGVIMPTFKVSDEAAADAICAYLYDNSVKDVFIMSEKDELVLRARKAYTVCRGVLDLTNELKGKTSLTNKELLGIRQRTNAAFASIAVIPDTVATTENVKYLYDRLIAVWVGASSSVTAKAQAFAIAAAGGHGAVTDNTALMYDVIENSMSGSKLFRVPLNIGHRGLPIQAPENTVEGSLLAYENGADCVENDIYITKDGMLMVMHDATTARTAGGNLTMESAASDQLRELIVNKQFPNNKKYSECRIPYLEEYFTALKGKDIQIFVEIKSTSKALVEKFRSLVGEYGVEDQVSVITFHDSQIKNLKEIFPEMSAGFLCNPLVSGDTGEKQVKAVLNKTQKLGSTYNPSYSGHTKEFVKNANMRGLTTWPWTIDDKGDYIDFFMAGYNGITTNNCKIPAKWAKSLVSKSYEYEIQPGETLKASAEMTTYKREVSDVSDSVRIIPLSDGMTVGDGNVITFDGEGEYQYALEYAYAINSSNTYTLYTQPVTVKVASPEMTDTETDEITTVNTTAEEATSNKPAETTGENENGKFPVVPVILGAAAGVIGVGLIVFFVVKKKKA